MSWSPDGASILIVTNSPKTGNDIWTLSLTGDRTPKAYQRTEASENWAAFSPDGRWVAFSSTAGSDVPEVYVTRFPTPGQAWRVSADGGSQARWRRDGKEIFYVAPDRQLMSAAVTLGADSVKVDRIEPLFALRFPYGAYHAFDVTQDGQRFLVNTAIASAARRNRRADDAAFGRPAAVAVTPAQASSVRHSRVMCPELRGAIVFSLARAARAAASSVCRRAIRSTRPSPTAATRRTPGRPTTRWWAAASAASTCSAAAWRCTTPRARSSARSASAATRRARTTTSPGASATAGTGHVPGGVSGDAARPDNIVYDITPQAGQMPA